MSKHKLGDMVIIRDDLEVESKIEALQEEVRGLR